MAALWYNVAKKKLVDAGMNLGSVDLRARLCMSNSTCSTQPTAANIAAFTTLDEFNGSGYTALDITNSTQQDDTNNRAEVHASAGNFGTTVGAGTRNIVGILYYVRVDGTNANDYPVAWQDLTAFNGNGGAINFTENAEGILWVS